MRNILSGILLLIQHIQLLNVDAEQFRPNQCPHCGKSGLWRHGFYSRKADYEHTHPNSLNPVPTPRFYCPHCRTTCSVLPECIPPKRHYPWVIQEQILLLILDGVSYSEASRQSKPSRWTISRWINKLQARQLLYASQLQSLLPSLGRIRDFTQFWQTLLSRHPLSTVMLNVNNAGLVVP